jgi:dephospho-CoA kinase
LAEITQTFGPSAIDKRGGLNRRRVAELVFADSLARERLEAIIHPRVRALARSEFAELERAGEPLACYEAALLFETGRADEFRPVVTVSTSEARCVARIMARDGSSEAQARDRLRAQLPLAQKVARADYVVDNDGTLSETRARTDEVLDGICWAAGVAVGRYPRNAP